MATVVMMPEAAAQFDELPRTVQARLLHLRERLEHWPVVSGARPLSGALAGHWRLRTGDYRLQFRVVADTIIVEKLGHRDRFYED